ncbi:hypothetical protein EDC94DRAFT_327795 [Helicostylum pulchrum]|nr:hypothetical protein EDC94DRAFT_327795 [Helicostylum pulchrum]
MELEVASEIELDYIEDIEYQDDEQEQRNDTDLSRRRLLHLQSIIRDLLLKSGKKSVSVQDLKDTSNDLEDKEISVYMLISNLIAPYIPDHKNRGSFVYQLPFLLMCNQIFRVTECFKFVIKLCTIIKPGSLSSLRMDATGLYSLFSSQKVKEKPLRVFDHNNQEITLKKAATEQKDVMFGSYFNLPKVFQRSASYGQDFQHYMIFLPGLQTVRLMGEIEKSSPCQTSIELQEPQEQVPSVVEKQSKRKVESQGKEERMKLLRKEQDDTMKELKLALEERKKFTVRQEIKQLKGQWVKGQKTPSNQVLFEKINKLKEKRDELQQKVFLLSNKKKELGKEIYYLNR